MQNINVVVLTCNLTKDPVLNHTEAGTPVCNMRVAVNGRRKNAHDEWVDKPNFFDVTVWGKGGERCAEYLAKGRPIAVEGRLDWREYTAADGTTRQSVQIVASSVQFLGGKPETDDSASATGSDDSGDRQPAGVGAQSGSDDDIPF